MALVACALGCRPETESEGVLRVLTYNVHGFPPEITGDDTAARMTAIGPLLGGYDLIGLQEDWLDEYHQLLDQAVSHPTRARFSEPNDAAYGPGLAVFAELDETSSDGTYFTVCNGVLEDANDCLASKGFQRVSVRASAADVDVYNTHLDAGGSDADQAARDVQVDAILEAIAQRSAERPVVLLGDLNLSSGTPAEAATLERFAAAGLLDACAVAGCAEPDHIDHILFRDGSGLSFEAASWTNAPEFVDDEMVPLSDHPAIAVELDWKLTRP